MSEAMVGVVLGSLWALGAVSGLIAGIAYGVRAPPSHETPASCGLIGFGAGCLWPVLAACGMVYLLYMGFVRLVVWVATPKAPKPPQPLYDRGVYGIYDAGGLGKETR